MRRNYFTEDEIVLCAYAALHDDAEFGGVEGIHRLTRRSRSSISMKIRNIIATLDEKDIARNPNFTALAGVARGDGGRSTNWDIVEPLTRKPQSNLQTQCRDIIARALSAEQGNEGNFK